MAKAQIQDILLVSKKSFFKVITCFEDYPQFVEGCTSVKVDRMGQGKSRVTFYITLMKEITYTLDLVEDEEAGTLSWILVSSDFFKKNTGFWIVKEIEKDQCDVTYGLDVDFKVPVPNFILNRMVSGSLPSMLKNFEKQARKF
jgi:ribosome-associated toxin RatA of RatAB toxin-antitoxin module